MILRHLGTRHGRRFIASSLPRRCTRSFSNDPIPPRPPPNAFEDSFAAPGEFSEPSAFAAPQTPDQPAVEQEPRPMPTNPAILAKMAQEAALARIPDDYRAQREIEKKTSNIGGKAKDVRWHLSQLLADAPSDASLELLMASQTHMGHHTSLWNPNNSRYIYGVRQGIHIISLETTLAHLRRAARVVEEVAFRGGLILFAGTRRGHMPIVVRAAELAGACHLFQKWKPGTITNRDVILGTGGLQVVDQLDKPIPGFEEHLQDRRPLVPDLVICFNPTENYTMLYECGLANVPTIGVIDTNADSSWVTYTIPANDDSLRSISVIACVLGRAGERGKKRRLAMARASVVTWETPSEITGFIKQNALEKAKANTAQDSATAKEEEVDELPDEDELKERWRDEQQMKFVDRLRAPDGSINPDLSIDVLYPGEKEISLDDFVKGQSEEGVRAVDGKGDADEDVDTYVDDAQALGSSQRLWFTELLVHFPKASSLTELRDNKVQEAEARLKSHEDDFKHARSDEDFEFYGYWTNQDVEAFRGRIDILKSLTKDDLLALRENRVRKLQESIQDLEAQIQEEKKDKKGKGEKPVAKEEGNPLDEPGAGQQADIYRITAEIQQLEEMAGKDGVPEQ